MTSQKAKVIFATHMQAARSRKLTEYERNQLAQARQVLRHSRKPAMNSRKHQSFQVGDKVTIKKHKLAGVIKKEVPKEHKLVKGDVYEVQTSSGSFYVEGKQLQAKENPQQPVLIYGQVSRIYATKTQNHVCDAECKKNGHRYFHDFKSKPKMYGLPDGSLLIKS